MRRQFLEAAHCRAADGRIAARESTEQITPLPDMIVSPEESLHADRTACRVEQHLLDIGAAADLAALVANQPFEGADQRIGASDGDRASCEFDRKGDNLDHLRGIGAFGIEAAVQAPGRPEGMHGLGSIGRLEIVARWPQRLSEPGQQCARSALPGLARNRHRHRSRPEPAAEQREQERRVGPHSVHFAGERGAVARRAGVEGRDVAFPVPRKQHVRTIGTQDAGWQVAVSDRESRAPPGPCRSRHRRARSGTAPGLSPSRRAGTRAP